MSRILHSAGAQTLQSNCSLLPLNVCLLLKACLASHSDSLIPEHSPFFMSVSIRTSATGDKRG